MIWWRPPTKARTKWYETKVADGYSLKGLATILVAKILFQPIYVAAAANDTDHCRW